MNWLVYHVASGHAFFSGVASILVAVLASTRSTRLAKRLTVWAFLLGAIAVAISSTATPYWYGGIVIAITIAWLMSGSMPEWRRRTRSAALVAWILATAIELPYHITPSLVPAAPRSMTVIGDSITAGMGASDTSVRWPAILAKEHDLHVQDISHLGETAASALQRAKSQPIVSPVVILEIGGNDLLGDTTSAQFARDLDALLAYVRAPGRQILMFELPLPPFQNEYGRIQRSLARKHNVALVPKRVLLSILAAEDATVDSIHLTQTGHQRMAASVWQLVGSAFPAVAEPDDTRERPAISGIENHTEDIRLSTLEKFAEAVGKRLSLRMG